MRLLSSLLIVFALATAVCADAVQYTVTNPVSTQKVQPAAQDAGPTATSLYIAMAKGEYEPAEVVVTPGKDGLEGLRVAANKLRSANGAVIPSQRVVVTPIACVKCGIDCPEAPMKGEVPDVLLPNKALDVAAGRHQSFYVTVQTKAEDAAGEYKGFVKVSADNAPTTLIPLTVRIYNITLPVKSNLHTAFALWGYFSIYNPATNTDRKLWMDAYIRYAKLMQAYRLTPIPMWAPHKKADGSYDFSDYDRYVSEMLPGGLTTMNIGANCQMACSVDTEWAKAAAKHFKDLGVWDICYVYGMDEAGQEQGDNLSNVYGALLKAVPDARIMQTGWNPRDILKDKVKIWCPLTMNADLEACHAAEKAGDEVWWYVCCGPSAPFANLFTDYSGVDHRILGWQTYKAGIQGFLYWAMDVYTSNMEPIDKYVDADYSNWQTASFNKNSDGILIYPGKYDTPIPSMRLAMLRDGFEDYDLFTEVNNLAAKKSGPVAEQAKQLLNFDAPLIKSLTEFTKNGNDLMARREAILKVAETMAEAKK